MGTLPFFVRTVNCMSAATSTVGAVAAMCLPAGDAATFASNSAVVSTNPSVRSDSIRTSVRMPRSRSRSLVLNPLMTLFTTISVATPSSTDTMHTNARYRVRR